MTLTQHTALTAVAAVVLAPFVDTVPLVVFAVGSILIDTDHYLEYVRRTKRLSVPGMFAYYNNISKTQRPGDYFGLHLFHTFEAFAVVALVALYQPLALWLFLGMAYHFLIDFTWLYRQGYQRVRAFTTTGHLLKYARVTANSNP
jgi:hypothetical protein